MLVCTRSNNHGLNQHCAGGGEGGVTISSDHERLYLTKNKMALQNSKTRCVLKRSTDIISMIAYSVNSFKKLIFNLSNGVFLILLHEIF
jgi:hypothetical protein